MSEYRPLIRKNGKTVRASQSDLKNGSVTSVNKSAGDVVMSGVRKGGLYFVENVDYNDPLLYAIEGSQLVGTYDGVSLQNKNPTKNRFAILNRNFTKDTDSYFEIEIKYLNTTGDYNVRLGFEVTQDLTVTIDNFYDKYPNGIIINSLHEKTGTYHYLNSTIYSDTYYYNSNFGMLSSEYIGDTFLNLNSKIRVAKIKNKVWFSINNGIWNGDPSYSPDTGIGGIDINPDNNNCNIFFVIEANVTNPSTNITKFIDVVLIKRNSSINKPNFEQSLEFEQEDKIQSIPGLEILAKEGILNVDDNGIVRRTKQLKFNIETPGSATGKQVANMQDVAASIENSTAAANLLSIYENILNS